MSLKPFTVTIKFCFAGHKNFYKSFKRCMIKRPNKAQYLSFNDKTLTVTLNF